ncbi:MAG: HAD family phosphatase [Candidatus Micrarchaeota archaeon]|nr:HAD family phosphatase [Candidatus Micrarchaeota archaeon]
MIKLLIFDIGGVLIEFNEIDYIRYVAKKHKLSVRSFSRALMPMIDLMEAGRMDLPEVEARMADKLHIPNAWLEWDSTYERIAKPKTDVKKLLVRLSRRYKVVLLSNVSETRYDVMKSDLIHDLKFRTFASCYLKMRKPGPRIYRYVLSKMKVSADEALFVDNLLVNVRGARKVGIRGIQFKSYAQLVRELRKAGIKG